MSDDEVLNKEVEDDWFEDEDLPLKKGEDKDDAPFLEDNDDGEGEEEIKPYEGLEDDVEDFGDLYEE